MIQGENFVFTNVTNVGSKIELTTRNILISKQTSDIFKFQFDIFSFWISSFNFRTQILPIITFR